MKLIPHVELRIGDVVYPAGADDQDEFEDMLATCSDPLTARRNRERVIREPAT